MGWLISIVLLLLACAAAVQMARRKGRNVNGWGTLTFFFAPSLLILLFVSAKRLPAPTSEPAISKCPACNGIVSVQAPRCPHCGHPLQSQTTRPTRPWYGTLIEVVGTLAVIVLLIGLIAFLADLDSEMPELACDQVPVESQKLAAYVKDAFSKPEMRLAIARNDTRALCEELTGFLPRIRRVSEASVRCKSVDQSALFLDQLISHGLSDCQ